MRRWRLDASDRLTQDIDWPVRPEPFDCLPRQALRMNLPTASRGTLAWGRRVSTSLDTNGSKSSYHPTLTPHRIQNAAEAWLQPRRAPGH